LLDLEELEEREIDAFRIRYQKMAAKAREVNGIPDTDSPEV